ncbi:hypothetical protein Bbelb_099770 [Branchiostoma belcheri]|nr:hypothetical protein Bbelb_099770 [Branchiostoma belcheri]
MSSSNPANVKHTARSRRSQTSGKHSESARVSKASVTTRRTCFCVLSTCKNVGKRRASVRGRAVTAMQHLRCMPGGADSLYSANRQPFSSASSSVDDMEWKRSTYITTTSEASVTTRRTCFCVLSTCKNVVKRRASVRGEYRLRTESYGFGSTQTRPTLRHVGWRSGTSFDCEPGDPGSIPSRTQYMSGHAPDVVSLGKALYTTFLTPPRCEWVPNFGWGKPY